MGKEKVKKEKSKKSSEKVKKTEEKKQTSKVEKEEQEQQKEEQRREPAPAYATPLIPDNKLEHFVKLVSKAREAFKNKKGRTIFIGAKTATKAIRKGSKGICLIAADTQPIDIFAHLPVMCEEAGVDFAFIPTSRDLKSAIGPKPQVCVMVTKTQEDLGYDELFQKCTKTIKKLQE